MPRKLSRSRRLLVENDITSSSSLASATLQQLGLDPHFFVYHDQVRMPFLGKKPAYSWLTTRLQEEYNGLPDIIKNSISSSRPHLRPASNVQVVIMPWTLALLTDYEPTAWARKFQRRCQGSSKPYTSPMQSALDAAALTGHLHSTANQAESR